MLYIVSTPIGNLGDISFRAVEVLKEVDLILCEDTRHTLILLNRYGIKKPLKKYEKFSERKMTEEVVAALKIGQNIALVSDAGTPLISDPGSFLTTELKREKIPYTAVGGQCAAINALVLSGMDATSFCFVGFLPEKNADRKRHIQKFAGLASTLIFYIPPHNIKSDVLFLFEMLGSRKACLVREISKMHEECIDFSLDNFPEDIVLKGEMVLVIEGASDENPLNSLDIEEHCRHYINKGMDEKSAMKQTAKDRGISKSEVYSAVKVDKN